MSGCSEWVKEGERFVAGDSRLRCFYCKAMVERILLRRHWKQECPKYPRAAT